MFFGLGGLIYVSVLLLNAVAILSEDRFLARIGWGGTASQDPGFGGQQDTTSVKARVINLISAVRTVTRIPLIAANTLIIAYLLVLG
ncbi:Yos1-like protein [Viridothelium virens]|uniref:Yos1-like protein n=1 Tax=Viridothelium virens TaxID=1048519 RepID=A0A6A6HAJ5_VIRVR|nr:Yos1-like protein [Viridothelium virens]